MKLCTAEGCGRPAKAAFVYDARDPSEYACELHLAAAEADWTAAAERVGAITRHGGPLANETPWVPS